jgi:hypothetical protein
MSPLKSSRLAWSVAIVSLALWASSAPVTWGQVAAGASSLIAQTADDDGSNSNPTTTLDLQTGETTITSNDGGAQSAPCPTPPPASAQQAPPTQVTPAAATGQPGTFHICGGDQSIETAIDQLIGGRGFSATLVSNGDGCADLTIRPTSGVTGGSSSSNLSVSLGAGKNLSIQIVSEHGATSASITVR